jgi:dipeptidyl aminopeptidase/acylaminoacyl peptidase
LRARCPAVADATRGFDVRDMVYLDRVSSPTLSPDGRVLVFAKRRSTFRPNKASTSLWIAQPADPRPAPAARLTPEGWNVNSPSFSADGKTVYFLSGKSGSMQLYWRCRWHGGEPTRLTELRAGCRCLQAVARGHAVALAFEVFPDCKADLDCTKKKLDDDGREEDQRQGVRPHVHPPLGYLERRPPQPLFAAKLGGAGSAEIRRC